MTPSTTAPQTCFLVVFQVLLEVLTGRRALEEDRALGERYLVREGIDAPTLPKVKAFC